MRRDLHKLLLLLGAAFGLAVAPAFAAFDDIGGGARGAGMADAQTAVADDAAAPFYNPAGLMQIVAPRLTADMSQEARGLSDGSKLGGTFFGYAHPIANKDTVLGAAYRSFGVNGLIKENTYLLGAGQRLRIRALGDGVLSIGANAKLMQRTFSPGGEASSAFNDVGQASGVSDPVLSGNPSATAFGVDTGALFQFGRRLENSVGAAILNLNQPDIGVHSTDQIPAIVKLGIAHRPTWGVLSAEMRRVKRLSGAADTDIALGGETSFRMGYRSAVTVRGGYAQGSRGYKAVTAGASYHFGRFDFDYAFSFPIGNLSELDGAQRFGVGVKFGGAAASAKPERTAYEKIDLLHSFAYDSLASHVVMGETLALQPADRSLANRLLARRYSLDDPGLSRARAELRDSLRDGREWAALVSGFTRGMDADDARRTTEALEAYTAGDARRTLARVAILSSEHQMRPSIIALQGMALAERAASAFRDGQLAVSLDAVRRLSVLMPASDLIRTGLRQLQAMQAAPPIAEPAPVEPVVERAAPAVVAPALETPVVPATPAVEAPVAPAQPVIVPAAVPVVVPAPVPVVVPVPAAPVQPVVAPAAPILKPSVPARKTSAAPSPAAKKAWAFYEEAVSREVSDYEKIEILEGMLTRFGEAEAERINKELARIRARLNRGSGSPSHK